MKPTPALRRVRRIAAAFPAFAAAALFVACGSSVKLPPTKESARRIDSLQQRLAQPDTVIVKYAKTLPRGNDLITTLRRGMLNSLLDALADDRADDVVIGFPPTRPLIREEKSLLGVSHTNELNVDSGRVRMDLKTLRIMRIDGDGLMLDVDITGKGAIGVSGKYLGVSASTVPEIDLQVHDSVRFQFSAGKGGAIEIRPKPGQRADLGVRISLALLAWRIPWRRDIPLEVDKLVPAFTIPNTLATRIYVPVHDANTPWRKVPLDLRLRDAAVKTAGGRVELRANLDFDRVESGQKDGKEQSGQKDSQQKK